MKIKTLPLNYIFANVITSFKKLSLAFFVGFFLFLVGMVPEKSVAGTLTIGAPTTAVAAANVCASSSQVPIHAFTITGSNSGGTLTGVSFVANGSFVVSDVVKFDLYSSSTNNFSSATLLKTISTPTGPSTTQSFTGLSQNIGNSTVYYWVTMNAASSVIDGHTIFVAGTSTTNIVSSGNTIAGSAPVSGTQILGKATINLSSGSATTSVCAGSAITSIVYTVGGSGTGASIPAGSLPSGVTGVFSGSTFTISGTPTVAGTYPYTITTTGSSCTNPSLSGTITVSQPSAAPTALAASTNPICSSGSGTTLTQSGGSLGTSASWKWYSDAGYTTLVGLGTGSTASLTVSPTLTTTYYLRAEGTSSPCSATVAGPAGGIVVTVNQPSVAPTSLAASLATICNGGSTTLTQGGGSLGTGASWKWYSDAGYTTVVGSGTGATASLTVSPTVTTTYYLRAEGTSSPCSATVAGPAGGVVVTVNQPSVAPTSLAASLSTICSGGSTTLTQGGGSLGTGASWKWYSDAGYTTVVGSGTGSTASLTVSPTVTTTYYLRAEGTSSPCSATVAGPAGGVVVTVNQPSVAPTSLAASLSTICSGGSTTLTQGGGSLGTGASWKWYSDAGYTTVVGSGTGSTASLTVSPTVTTTYYLRAEGTSSPCSATVAGPAGGVVVTVNQPSVAPTSLAASLSTICSGGSTTLTQGGGSLGTGASWKWYSDAGYTTVVGSGTGSTASLTVSPTVTTTYYLRAEGTSSPCSATVAGPAGGVVVTVNQPSVAPTSLAASLSTICSGGSTTLTQGGGSLGTGASWKWYSDAGYTTVVGSGTGSTASLTVSPTVTTTYYLRAEGTSSPCSATVAGPAGGVVVTVNSLPAITGQPSTTAQTVCPNGSATLSVAATGTNLAYQWYSNTTSSNTGGTLINGATSASYSPVTTTPGTSYYYVIVSGTCTPAVTSDVSGAITVNTPPAITGQPSTASQIVCPNGAASLSVTATGTGLTYEWYSNTTASNSGGSSISGATAATYTPVTTTPGTLYYYVVVGGSCTPGVTSDFSGAVTVNAPPAITGQPSPASQVLCVNSTSNQLSVVATGTGLTYQWYSNTVASNSGGNAISGAISSTYSPLTTSPGTSYYYVVVSGTCTPAVTSNTSGAITVNNPPAIGTQPVSKTVCSNTTASFTVGASGTGSLTYAWYKEATLLADGPRVSGATTSTITLSLLNAGSSGKYSVVVSDASACAATKSDTAILTVNQEINVTSQPAVTQTLCEGSNATFNVTAQGTGPFNVQWYNGNTAINSSSKYAITANADITTVPPTITTSLTINSIVPADASSNYYVIISNPAGICPNEVSNPASLVVNPTPNVVATPTTQTICSGGAITMIALTGNVPSTSFNWTRDNTTGVTGIAGTGSGNIAGSLTNTTNAPITVTFTITPTANNCPGTAVTATVVVNPTPNAVATPSSQTICSGDPITAIALSGNVATTTFNWTRDNTTGVAGISASGSGDISGTVTNTTTAPITVTFTITPTANNCTGAAITATVVVNPTPNVVATPAAQTKCSGSAITSIVLTSSTTGTTYGWSRDNTADVTGIAASGSGNISGTLTNTTTAPITVTFTITPTANNCTGAPITATVVVNPTPNAVATPASQTVCTGSAITPIVLSSSTTGTTFSWTRNTATGLSGIPASGNGDISGTLTNTTAAPITVTFTITPTANGCPGASITATVVVNPSPNATASPSSQSICTGSAITTIALSSTTTGATFAWTRDNTSSVTGIAASGTGNITGNLTNATASPITVTFTITPTANNCSGAPITATVVVNPTPNAVATPSSQSVCSGTAITTIVLSSSTTGTTYAWSRDNTTGVTGIAASGTGNITGSLTNTTASPITVTFTITPTANGCLGAPITATVVVNPSPNVTATPSSQAICTGSAITTIALTSTTPGTTFAWTRNTPAGISGISASGSGDISGTVTNTTTAPITVTFTITPTANNCTGAAITATVVVNPTPNVVATPAAQTKCSGSAITSIVLTSSTTGTTYGWSRDNTADVTGIAASGSGNISGTLTNTTTAPITVTFTITPTANNCTGAPITATVVVNPTPNAVATPASQTVCTGSAITPIVLSSSTTGTTFSWTRNTATGLSGIPASGNGDISGTLTNTTAAPITVTFTITPTANGCPGASITATVVVNPSPNATASPSSQSICTGSAITTIALSSTTTGATFAWTRDNTSSVTGIAASGTGNITGNLTNATASPITVTFTITPTANNCSGAPITATVVVNPTPNAVATPSSQSVCSGTAITTIVLSSSTTGTTYAWSRDNTTGVTGIAASGTGNITGSLTNTTASPITVTFTITPTINGCPGTPTTATVVVSPAVNVTATPSNQTICTGNAITPITLSSTVTGTTYAWTRNSPAGISGIPTSGSGDISGTLINTTSAPITVTFTITPTANNCVGSSRTATIIVNPDAFITLTSGAATNSQTVCINSAITRINYNVTGGVTGASVSGLPGGVNGTYSNGVVTINGIPIEAGTFNYTVTTIGSCVQTSATGSITVSPPAVGGTLSPATAIECYNSNNGTINLSGQTGSVIRWELSTNGGSTWSAVANTTTFLTYSSLTTTTSYRAVIQNTGACATATSSTSVITVNPVFIPDLLVSPASTICLGDAITLTASGFNEFNSITGGDFANANPTGWVVKDNGTTINFPANANNTSVNPWSETNGPKSFLDQPNTITYDCQFPGKFAIVTGVENSTLETPVFSTVGSSSSSLDFYQAFNFAAGTIAKIEISTDGGNTYNATPLVQYSSPSTFGVTNGNFGHVSIPLTGYLGMSNLRIRFNYSSTGPSSWAINTVIVGGTKQPVTYTWTSNFGYSGTGQRVTTSPTNAGDNIFTVSTSINSCATTIASITVRVNPVAAVNNSSVSTCSGTSFTATLTGVLPTGTTYKWTAPVISPAGSITGGSAQAVGLGSISQTLTNTTTSPATATYTVTPTSGSCQGNTFTVTVTVNPRPTLNSSLSPGAVCSGSTFSYAPSSTTSGATFSWTRASVTGISNAAITTPQTSNPNEVLNNTTSSAVTVTYVYTISANGCTNTQNVVVSVNPAPIAYTVTGGGSYCTGGTGVAIGLSNSQTNVSYQLYNGTSTIGSARPGTTGSSINFGLQTAGGTYTVKATPSTGGGCTQDMANSVTVTVTSSPVVTDQTIPAVCSEVPFTFTPSNAPTGTTYTWLAPTYTGPVTGGGAQTVGQNSISQTLTNNELVTGTAIYTVTPTVGGCAGNTFKLTATVNTNTWNGSVSTDWSTAANWCSNKVPTQFSSAIIPSGLSRYPVLSEASFIKSISIGSNTTITLNGKGFNIYGSVLDDGTGLLVGDAAATLALEGAGSGNLYFSQTTDSITNVLKDLSINTATGTEAFTVGNQLYVLNELVPKMGTLNANGNLTIRSTSVAATARVAEAGPTAKVIGDVTVERFIPAKRAFRFLSPSVTTTTSIKYNWMEDQISLGYWGANKNDKPGYGTHITGRRGFEDGFDYNATGYSSLFYYDNVRQAWDSAANTFGTLKAGVPWRVLVRGSRSADLSNNEAEPSNTIIRAKGSIKTGDVVYDASGSNGPVISSVVNGWSLVGNPYASAVDWNKMTGSTPATSNGLSRSYTAWDPMVNVRGAYVTYDGATNSKSNINSQVDNNIQSGQGFFIRTTGGNPKLTFLESYKTTSRTQVFREASDRPRLSVQLLLNQSAGSQNTADGLVAVFDEGFKAEVGDEDSYKFTNLDETMAIDRKGVALSIEARPIIKGSDTIPLKITQFRQKSYFLKLNGINFDRGVTALVKDAYLGVETPININAETVIPFNLTGDAASAAPNRFAIIFNGSKALPVVVTDIKASLKDNAVKVEWTSYTETNIDRYEIERSEDGQNFVKQGFVSAKGNNSTTQLYEWLDQMPLTATNFYRIKIVEKSGEVRYTAVVKVDIAKTAGSITVYPNPVKGNRFTINLKNMEKGRYNVILYNNIGQIVFNTIINHDGRNVAYPVITKVITKGSYQLHISNSDIQKSELVIFD